MISFFPDLNVWLALSVSSHSHSSDAWNWLTASPQGSKLIFSRYTHIGLLRLLTNPSVMGEQTLTLNKAWSVYDRWLRDPRVEFYPEPRGIDEVLREVTRPFDSKHAFKWVGDCYLLACAIQNQATLVTFDRGLQAYARSRGYPVGPR